MNSLIVCEGYQDRAFVGAWVNWLGQRDKTPVRSVTQEKDQQVRAKGAHVKACGNRQLCIAPAGSYEKVTAHAADLLKANSALLDRACLVVDADEQAPKDREKAVTDSLRGKGYAGPLEVIVWAPQLEAIIEQALRGLNASAMTAIDEFLTKAHPTAATKKERAFVYCAAWEPDNFGESFFGLVWRDGAIRQHLEPLVSTFEPQLLRMLG